MKLLWPIWANYFAVDSNGEGYFFEWEPEPSITQWKETSGQLEYVIQVNLNGVDWRTTLIERPELREPNFTDVKKQLEEQ